MTTAPLVYENARTTYNFCGCCGRVPKSNEEPNWAPKRWWDPDDGWKITSLCRWCWDEVALDRPKPTDYAYYTTNRVVDIEDTDEDPTMCLE